MCRIGCRCGRRRTIRPCVTRRQNASDFRVCGLDFVGSGTRQELANTPQTIGWNVRQKANEMQQQNYSSHALGS